MLITFAKHRQARAAGADHLLADRGQAGKEAGGGHGTARPRAPSRPSRLTPSTSSVATAVPD